MTNSTTPDSPNSPQQAELSRKVCPTCLGGGISNYVTREMAFDAGDICMAGAEIRCTECGGDGWVYE